jgi:hypothetical protein
MQVKVVYWKNKGPFFDFDKAYEVETEHSGKENDDTRILEDMFFRFNCGNRPDAKIRPSMSVGDIVSIDGRAYACVTEGWLRL